MDRKPGLSRLICLRRQPGIGQSLFMLRSMGSDASPFKHQHRPAQSTQTAGEPFYGGNVSSSIANLTRRDATDFLEIAPKAAIKTETVVYRLDAANEALAD